MDPSKFDPATLEELRAQENSRMEKVTAERERRYKKKLDDYHIFVKEREQEKCRCNKEQKELKRVESCAFIFNVPMLSNVLLRDNTVLSVQPQKVVWQHATGDRSIARQKLQGLEREEGGGSINMQLRVKWSR